MAKGLTAKQEKFCVEYVNGGSKSFSDAYRVAFDCSRMKPASVNRRAFALKEDVKIRARIKELQDEAAELAMVTLAGHLEDLKRIRDEARKAGQFGAAVNAEIYRGKASGLYTERTEVNATAIPVIKPVIEFPMQKPEDKSDADS